MPSKVDLKVDDFVEQNKIVHNPCSHVNCVLYTVLFNPSMFCIYHDFVLVMLTNAMYVFALNGRYIYFLYRMKYWFNKFV